MKITVLQQVALHVLSFLVLYRVGHITKILIKMRPLSTDRAILILVFHHILLVESDTPVGIKLLLPHVPVILTYLRKTVEALHSKTSKQRSFPTRELNILARYCIFC